MKIEKDKMFWRRTKESQKEFMEELREQGLVWEHIDVQEFEKNQKWGYVFSISAKNLVSLKELLYNGKLYNHLLIMAEYEERQKRLQNIVNKD